jgi:intracellular septation protein A
MKESNASNMERLCRKCSLPLDELNECVACRQAHASATNLQDFAVRAKFRKVKACIYLIALCLFLVGILDGFIYLKSTVMVVELGASLVCLFMAFWYVRKPVEVMAGCLLLSCLTFGGLHALSLSSIFTWIAVKILAIFLGLIGTGLAFTVRPYRH